MIRRELRRRSTQLALLALAVLAAMAGCSAPVRQQAKAPGQNTRAVPKSKTARQPTAVIRGTLGLTATAMAPYINFEESVVFVAAAPKSPAHPERVVVGQTTKAFTPRVSVVAIGDTVVFENRDHIYHSVFSVSPARRFEIGSYGPGNRRKVGFDREGNVRVFCDMHSATSGYIYVVPSRVAVRPTPAGKWSLPPLPLGRYQIRAWHPDLGERQWTIDLTSKGLTKELRF